MYCATSLMTRTSAKVASSWNSFRCLVNATQQQDLDQAPERRHHQSGDDDAAPEAQHPAHLDGQGRSEIKPQHVEGAVSDIDDPGDAEDQRQTGAHEEQAGRRGKPVERLEKEGFETHGEEAALEHDPEKLQTFRIRSCARTDA
jgi:hypothetical protein